MQKSPPRFAVATKVALAALAASTLTTTAAAQSSAELAASNDTFIRNGTGSGVTGGAQVLESRAFNCRIDVPVPYIQFDLSALNIDEITNATLFLQKVPGGPGGPAT
jgi:hypothetical protein